MVSKIVKVTRIKEWFHFLGVPILGYIFKSSQVYWMDIILIIIVGVATLSYGFIINYWANINDNYRPSSWLIVSSLSLIPTAILVLILYPQAYIFWFLTVLFLFLYSFPPFALKRFPVIVTLINSISLALFFLFGLTIKGELTFPGLIFSLFLGLNLVPLQLIHEWKHKEEDLKNGCISTAALLSPQKIKGILITLYTLILIFSFYLYRFIEINFFRELSLIFVISSLILLIYFNKNKKVVESRKYLKLAGVIYSIGILILLIL